MAAQTTTPRLFDVDELPDIYIYHATQSDPPEAPEVPRAPLLIRADLIELRPPNWLLRRILERDALALIFGDPGCGKTFVALDWAARIATGTPWRGYPVKPAPVVYLAGEGPQRLGRRLLAWQRLNSVSLTDDTPLYIWHAVAISEPKEVARLLRTIDSLPEPPALIVLDTLARCFGAGDEDSTQDMTRFIAGCDAIRRHCGASVLIVHHSGHGDKTRARGAMALKAALDAEYRLEQTGGGNLLLTATKMRDAEVPAPMGLRLEPVELPGMVDEDGNPVTSAAIEVVDADTSAIVAMAAATTSKRGKRGKWQSLGLDIAKRLAAASQDGTVAMDAWREQCQTEGMPRERWYDIRQPLADNGDIAISEDGLSFRVA